MKNAFTEKVTSLTSELSKLKSESRRRINEAEEEIKQTKTMKDIFLKQVIELQKKLNI